MIDVQDVRLDLLAIASATDCPMRAAAAHQLVGAERRGARSADLARQAWWPDVVLLTIASALDRHLWDGPPLPKLVARTAR